MGARGCCLCCCYLFGVGLLVVVGWLVVDDMSFALRAWASL